MPLLSAEGTQGRQPSLASVAEAERRAVCWRSHSWEACPRLPALVLSHQAGVLAARSHCRGFTRSPCPRSAGRTKARHSVAKNGAVERKGSSGHSTLCPEQPHRAQLLSALGPPERNNRLMRNNLSEQVFWKSSPHEVQPYGQPLNERPDHKHGLGRLGVVERGAGPGPGVGTGRNWNGGGVMRTQQACSPLRRARFH